MRLGGICQKNIFLGGGGAGPGESDQSLEAFSCPIPVGLLQRNPRGNRSSPESALADIDSCPGDVDATLFGYRVRMTSQFFKAPSTPSELFLIVASAAAVERIIAWCMEWDGRVCCEQAAHVSFSQIKAPAEEEEEEYDFPASPPRPTKRRKARDPVFSRIPIAVRYMSKAHSPVVEALSLGARLVDPDPRRFDANWGLEARTADAGAHLVAHLCANVIVAAFRAHNAFGRRSNRGRGSRGLSST